MVHETPLGREERGFDYRLVHLVWFLFCKYPTHVADDVRICEAKRPNEIYFSASWTVLAQKETSFLSKFGVGVERN